MKDQVILVTGGSRGMGKAMAAEFVKRGACVTITGRDADRLAAAKAEIEGQEGAAGRVLTVQMDVRDPALVQETIEQTKNAFGKVTGLVNNAAGNFLCHAEDLSINGWNAVINIVLNGTFYCSQAVAKEWIRTGEQGSILNIVATYAWTAGAGVVHSAAAKAGVLSMTRTLAVEWGAKYGIRVNAIAPGAIEGTGGADKLFPDEAAYKQTLNSIPFKRLGTTNEIAGLAAFLFSSEAAYINGDCITMDAGQWLNRMPF
ncbi:MAG TPA: 2,4-dienoyl-CoA reductase [Bacilli bacterium]|nr:2,4-dienoyl-CoA reductase [Bacilli bacterium]